MNTSGVRHISVSVNCNPKKVYDFIVDPKNLPSWATGLGTSVNLVNGDWIADSPMGKVKIKFADKNNFGVADHYVTLESGISFNNPMRVIANQQGSEVVFTLFRQPDMTDDKFAEDANWVKKDLEKLKTVLEAK